MKFSTVLAGTFAAMASSVMGSDDPPVATSSPSKENRVPAIEIKGNKFFYSNNGTQFFLKGVAYQADTANSTEGVTINDPLADFETCSRDLKYLKYLNTNTVRVYAVNTTLDHSKCMELFESNGIYVIADLSEPATSVNRDSPSWDVDIYKRYTDVVDSLANYTNVLGFFAGNEVTNSDNNTDASAFVKAALRDTKAYIKEKGYRKIPVGYSSNDDEDTRLQIADYFACGDDEERADFYGINMYEWCGESNFKESGFEERTKEFANLGIPLFFSEYGCNEIRPRKFTEVKALYGKDMIDVWSGGIVYMYFEEDNEYGLVKIKNGEVSTLKDYDNLRTQLASISPTVLNSASYSPTSVSVPSCPTSDEHWKAATKLPPTPNEDACKCFEASLSCKVSDKVDVKEYGDLYDYLCKEIDCSDIAVNGTTGEYGPVAYCPADVKLSYLLNKFYESKGKKNSSACEFSGSATLVSASADSTCKSVISAATDGANAPSSGKGPASSGSDSGSASKSEGKSSSGAAGVLVHGQTNAVLGSLVAGFFFLGFTLSMV